MWHGTSLLSWICTIIRAYKQILHGLSSALSRLQSRLADKTLGIRGVCPLKRDCIPERVKAGYDLLYFNPRSTAVPFWGQITWYLSVLSPERDCSLERDKAG